MGAVLAGCDNNTVIKSSGRVAEAGLTFSPDMLAVTTSAATSSLTSVRCTSVVIVNGVASVTADIGGECVAVTIGAVLP